jgi:hypothetical protein
MWDTAETTRNTVTHDMPCSQCGHATHTYLPCSDECACVPSWLGAVAGDPRLTGAVAAGVGVPEAA